jgi:hypothetical protein
VDQCRQELGVKKEGGKGETQIRKPTWKKQEEENNGYVVFK